jgi:Phytanoyl-CoA dioxygenase (PhyH)
MPELMLQEIETNGFVTIDSYLNPDWIEVLIQEIGALELTLDRAGSRNILELAPSVRKLAHSSEIRSLVEPILGERARVVRGLFFDKNATKNWKVPWHQDRTIAVVQQLEVPDYQSWSLKDGIPHVQPPAAILERMLTVRIHLDRTDELNGALKIIPGSHRHGKLTNDDINRWKLATPAVACNCEAGGILLMRPLLLHASSTATIRKHRRIIHLDYAIDRLPGGLEWYYENMFDRSKLTE